MHLQPTDLSLQFHVKTLHSKCHGAKLKSPSITVLSRLNKTHGHCSGPVKGGGRGSTNDPNVGSTTVTQQKLKLDVQRQDGAEDLAREWWLPPLPLASSSFHGAPD